MKTEANVVVPGCVAFLCYSVFTIKL